MAKSVFCALGIALSVLAGHDFARGQEPKRPGTADNVGTQTYIVQPEEWQTGFVGRYRRDFQRADCDPHPFTPTVRVEASLR